MNATTMKVLHISERHTVDAGGTTKAVQQLCSNLKKYRIETCILASGDHPIAPPAGTSLYTTQCEKTVLGKLCHYSPNFLTLLKQAVSEFKPDVIHIHGFWMAPQFQAIKLAHKLNIPTVLSPHGSLFFARWQKALSFGYMKKQALLHTVLKHNYRKSTVIHAITSQEQDLIKNVFPDNDVPLIPNFIDLQDELPNTPPLHDRRYILSLGRISPEKGIDQLIEAFLSMRKDVDCELRIYGPIGNQKYFDHLKTLTEDHPRQHLIRFLPPVYGDKKTRTIQQAWVTVIPSHTEVIGLVNLESSNIGTPTITTNETGLNDWNQSGGYLVHKGHKALRHAIERALDWSIQERVSRGLKAKKFIAEHYSVDHIMPLWIRLYYSIANANAGGPQL